MRISTFGAACVALTALGMGSFYPVRAQAPGGPLGGSLGGPLGENPDNPGPATSGGSTSGGEPAKSADVLPFDLGAVRRLKVAGVLLNEIPMRVGSLDMLAPIVPYMAKLGASVTRAAPAHVPGNLNTPTQDQFFQINLPQGPPIVLTIGQASVFVNHVEQPLRAAPLIINDKIWVPVCSLAPLLGAAARLEGNGTLHLNPTVQSVEIFPVKGMLALTVKTSAPLLPGGVLMGTMSNPPKLYLDFPGYAMGFDAANSTLGRVVTAGLGNVQQARAGMFRQFPDTTRIVLDLKQPLTGVRQMLPDATLFALVLVPPGKSATDVVTPIMTMQPPGAGSLRGLTIVLDAGHGGHDPGAPGTRSMEKAHNLDIVRRLRSQLMARGATVLLTREGDYFITLQGRVDFANSRKADIFLSVHINGSVRKTVGGTGTYYWTANSLFLAREVQNELAKATGLRSHGVIQARFFVIRRTSMPAVLTETCFISNPREETLLLKPEFRDRVARGMAQGITNYATRFLRPATVAG